MATGLAALAHPPMEGGGLVGHGGVALRLYAGLSPMQQTRLVTQGHCEAPRGRGGACYWPLKTRTENAIQSAVNNHVDVAPEDVFLRPVSVTYVGLLKMVEGGQLGCVDEQQWRLYAPLQLIAPTSLEGHSYYRVHDVVTPE